MQSANNKNSTGNDWLWRFLDEVLYPAWLKGLNHNCIQICMSRQWQATTTLSRVWWREIALFNYFPRCFRIDSEMEPIAYVPGCWLTTLVPTIGYGIIGHSFWFQECPWKWYHVSALALFEHSCLPLDFGCQYVLRIQHARVLHCSCSFKGLCQSLIRVYQGVGEFSVLPASDITIQGYSRSHSSWRGIYTKVTDQICVVYPSMIVSLWRCRYAGYIIWLVCFYCFE